MSKTQTTTDAECPECCCVLAICCDPAAAQEALADKIVKDLDCTPSDARKHAAWIRQHFALAPKSFAPLLAEIVKMAKAHP